MVKENPKLESCEDSNSVWRLLVFNFNQQTAAKALEPLNGPSVFGGEPPSWRRPAMTHVQKPITDHLRRGSDIKRTRCCSVVSRELKVDVKKDAEQP